MVMRVAPNVAPSPSVSPHPYVGTTAESRRRAASAPTSFEVRADHDPEPCVSRGGSTRLVGKPPRGAQLRVELVDRVKGRMGHTCLVSVAGEGDPHGPRLRGCMSRRAVYTTAAVAALSIAVLSSAGCAQDDQTTAQELVDLRARAEAGDALAQFKLGNMYAEGRGVPLDDTEAGGLGPLGRRAGRAQGADPPQEDVHRRRRRPRG